ncbi:MAG: peptidase M28 [bacterium]|nr:MAG: peptidase M28 [bacterium]
MTVHRPSGGLPALILALLSLNVPRALAFEPITADELMVHVRTLASDEFGGRGTGDPGGELAARYIARSFEQAGLVPAGDNGGWYQEFQAKVATSLGPDNRVTTPVGATTRDFLITRDFIPLACSATGQCSGPVVFAGYGVSAPDLGYDDYAGLDVTGKIVLCLRYEPARDDTGSAFEGRKDTWHAGLRSKARNAETHGAIGLILVNGPLSDGGTDELLLWEKGGTSQAVGIPAMMMTRKAVESFWGAGLPENPPSLVDAQSRIDGEGRPWNFDVTSGPITLRGDVRTESRTTRNVVGWLPPNAASTLPAGGGNASQPSSPPSEPHLVIGAHYDHLGQGGQHSLSPDTLAIHNGADDNASGTAGLMELAEAIASDPAPRSSGIVFVAFAAEELGLLGATWYADHPLRSIDSMVAMLNMDMVGRLRNDKLEVGGVGTSPSLRPVVEEAYRGTAIKVTFGEGGSGPSDHKVFNDRKRPVLFFFTGVHEDYHRPSDDWEKINAPGMERVADGVRRVTMTLAAESSPLAYVAVAADTAQHMGATSGSGASLGTIPDYTESEIPGLKLSGVRAGGPGVRRPGDPQHLRPDGRTRRSPPW